MVRNKVLIFVFIVRLFNFHTCVAVTNIVSKQAMNSAADGENEEVYIKQNVLLDYSRANSKYFIDNYESLNKENSEITIETDLYFNYRRTEESNVNGEKHAAVSSQRRPAYNGKHRPFIEHILQRTKRFNFPAKPQNFHESINRNTTPVSHFNRNQLQHTTEQNNIDSTPASGDGGGGVEFYFTDKPKPTTNNTRSSVQQLLSTTISFVRHQTTNLSSNETLATRIRSSGGDLKFLDVPPGGGMRTPDLELDDGYSIFSFISSSLGYLQTSDFPAGKLARAIVIGK